MFRVLVVWISILTTPLWAQEFKPVAESAVVFNALKAAAVQSKTIEADFTEERYVSYLKTPEKSTGKFYYKQDDHLRWEQIKPNSYVILIAGNQLRVAEQGKEKNVKTAGKIADKIKTMMLTMVNGDFYKTNDFDKKCFQSSTEYQVVLVPKDKRLKARYDNITMHFQKKGMVLKTLAFYEKGGDKQVMTFSNEKVNRPIDSKLFQQF